METGHRTEQGGLEGPRGGRTLDSVHCLPEEGAVNRGAARTHGSHLSLGRERGMDGEFGVSRCKIRALGKH